MMLAAHSWNHQNTCKEASVCSSACQEILGAGSTTPEPSETPAGVLHFEAGAA